MKRPENISVKPETEYMLYLLESILEEMRTIRKTEIKKLEEMKRRKY